MLKRTLTCAIVTYSSVVGAALASPIEITGGLTCLVTSDVIVTSDDGKPAHQEKITNLQQQQLSVFPESSIAIEYRSSALGFEVTALGGGIGHIMTATYLYEYPEGYQLSPLSTKDKLDFTEPYTHVYFSADAIRVLAQSSELQMERYHEDDWHGTLTISPYLGIEVQIVTLDCRTEKNAVNEVIRDFYRHVETPI